MTLIPVLTLTTDFGSKDGFTGTMKGVIWSICPEAQIADISHEIAPQNVLEGAYVLWRAYPFFPSGTIHIAVVDPGVGTQRRPIVMRLGDHTFVGPDNGLFTLMLEDAEKNGWKVEILHLMNEKYFLSAVSRTFHGRDIFAPVGAHLARGVALTDLGPFIHDPVRINIPKPERTSTGWRAHVTVVDVFGNCATDIPAQAVNGFTNVSFHVHGHTIQGLVETYGHKKTNEMVAVVDSEGFIEIAVVNGSAAKLLGLKVGDVLDVDLPS